MPELSLDIAAALALFVAAVAVAVQLKTITSELAVSVRELRSIVDELKRDVVLLTAHYNEIERRLGRLERSLEPREGKSAGH